MAAWRERPRRFVEPPLVNHIDCKGFKESVAKELHQTHVAAEADIEKVGGMRTLKGKNTYMSYFRSPRSGPITQEHAFTHDRVKDSTAFDATVQRDTSHPQHTQEARMRCKVPLVTKWPVRSSQAYGWLPPVDEPNYGLGKSSIFIDGLMDKSHLGSSPRP